MLLALDLDDAHPAGAEARQLGLVAEGRDLDAVVAADLEDGLALEALDGAAVDLDADARRALRPLRALRGDVALGDRVLQRDEGVGLDRLVRAALGPAVIAAMAIATRLVRGRGAEAARIRGRRDLGQVARVFAPADRRLAWRDLAGALDQVRHAVAPTGERSVARRTVRQTPAGQSPRR